MRGSDRVPVLVVLLAGYVGVAPAEAGDRVASVRPAVPDRVEARYVPVPLEDQRP